MKPNAETVATLKECEAGMGEVIYGYDFKAKPEKERGETEAENEPQADWNRRMSSRLEVNQPDFVAPETDSA